MYLILTRLHGGLIRAAAFGRGIINDLELHDLELIQRRKVAFDRVTMDRGTFIPNFFPVLSESGSKSTIDSLSEAPTGSKYC
jgi:hypothetical protein